MSKPFLSTEGKKRLFRLLSVYATAFGACAALQQFFEPFTENGVWALITASAGTVVIGIMILAYVLFREHSGRRTALSVLVQAVLVVVGAFGGVLVGALLRAPVTPPADGASGGTTTTITTTTTAAAVTTTSASPTSGSGSALPEPTTAARTDAPLPATTKPEVTTPPASTTRPPPPPPSFGISTPSPVTFCTDIDGWGDPPAEGRAVILVRQVKSTNVFYEQPIDFHGDGTWTAKEVHVGDLGQENDFMLTAQAMTQADVDWYKQHYTNSQSPVSTVYGRPLAAKEVHRSNQTSPC